MKINKIKTGGLWWKIKYVTTADLPTNELADIVKDDKTIKIEDDLAPDIEIEVLLHEIFHALNWEMNEEKTELWAMAWFQVLKDNPQFIKYLSQKLTK